MTNQPEFSTYEGLGSDFIEAAGHLVYEELDADLECSNGAGFEDIETDCDVGYGGDETDYYTDGYETGGDDNLSEGGRRLKSKRKRIKRKLSVEQKKKNVNNLIKARQKKKASKKKLNRYGRGDEDTEIEEGGAFTRSKNKGFTKKETSSGTVASTSLNNLKKGKKRGPSKKKKKPVKKASTTPPKKKKLGLAVHFKNEILRLTNRCREKCFKFMHFIKSVHGMSTINKWTTNEMSDELNTLHSQFVKVKTNIKNPTKLDKII